MIYFVILDIQINQHNKHKKVVEMENTRELAKKITIDNISSMNFNLNAALHDIMLHVDKLSITDMVIDQDELFDGLRLFGRSELFVHPLHSDAKHRMDAYAMKFVFTFDEVNEFNAHIKVSFEILDETKDERSKIFVEDYTHKIAEYKELCGQEANKNEVVY
mgnify:CR=1 FL=1